MRSIQHYTANVRVLMRSFSVHSIEVFSIAFHDYVERWQCISYAHFHMLFHQKHNINTPIDSVLVRSADNVTQPFILVVCLVVCINNAQYIRRSVLPISVWLFTMENITYRCHSCNCQFRVYQIKYTYSYVFAPINVRNPRILLYSHSHITSLLQCHAHSPTMESKARLNRYRWDET